MKHRADRDELAEVQRALRASLSPFGPEYWQQVERDDAFPVAAFEAMAEAGYFGTMVPAAYGGVDAGPAVASVVVEEVGRAGGDATVVNAQMSICGTLVRDGTEEQRARYLPGVVDGTVRFLSVAATEPDSGADMSTLESTARRDGDDWIIDAKKVMISLAEHTRLMIVLTRSDAGPTLFLLDLDDVREQIEIRPIDMITHRMTTMVFIDGLRVPSSCLLGEPGQGLSCLMKGFAPRRAMAAAECIGNARFMLDQSLEHAKQRRTFGRFIGQNQGVQYPLAQAYAKVESADLMRWDALRAIDEDDEANARSALAKVVASEAAWETARAALTTFGGWGLADEYHVERKLRESTVFVFNNLLWSMIAQKVLGLPKAY
jgi:acyl-CoA dehydrogenase